MNQDIWKSIISQLKTEIPAARFNAWILPIQATFDKNRVTLNLPSRFFLERLKSLYGQRIAELVQQYCGKQFNIQYNIEGNINGDMESEASERTRGSIDGYIDPRFTFENFVVDSNNELCVSACQAVVNKPGQAYNPLYIYSDIGLGKTHLIHALANALIEKKHKNIANLSSERFHTGLTNAIRDGAIAKVRHQFHNVDILIIDMLQFLTDKSVTQKELLHIINVLHGSQKQIVIASSCPPNELDALDKDLFSFFNSGLVVEIKVPDFKARLEIIANQAKSAGISLDDDVSYMLASRITDNIRVLKGALTRLIAHSALTNKTINLDLAKHILRDALRDNPCPHCGR